MVDDPRDLAAFALAGLGAVLVIFAIGAQSGWLWATKSISAPRPPWIVAVLAIGGACFGGFSALRGDWLSALLTAGLYAIIVGGSLKVGPLGRRSGGGETP
jgi:hypothetical protein